jgi:hypothetical protein
LFVPAERWLGTAAEGAWALLLGRYAGADDAGFGVVRAGRGSGVDGDEEINGKVDRRALPEPAAVHGVMRIDIPVPVPGRFPRQLTTGPGGGGAPVRVVTANGPLVTGRARQK